MGAFLDGEWESICKLFTVDESPDLSANFFEYSSPANEPDESPAFAAPSSFSHVDINSFSSLSGWISKPPHNFIETRKHTNTDSFADNFLPEATDILSCIDFSMVNGEIDGSFSLPFLQNTRNDTMSGDDDAHTNNAVNMSSAITELTLKRKREVPLLQDDKDEKTSLMETPKKNARTSKHGLKDKKKANQKTEEEITATVITKETNEIADSNSDDSIPCASEEITETEDSNSNMSVSQSSNGKKRANRGAATDPQSLYARKRRMRINERLRILQNLVPNGTKVDISTMLEEAFHYVKFLQLQIRLLSSDDLWMYASLAYNGLDVGAFQRMSPFFGL